MFQQVIDFFNAQQWVYSQIDDETMALIGIHGKRGNKFQCMVDINEEEKRFIFLSICSANVPEAKRSEMCELLTRINFGKFLGNFEMDYSEGEIRYKTSAYSDNLSYELIEQLIMTNIVMMDNSLESIMKLIYGNITPLEAFDLIENAQAV